MTNINLIKNDKITIIANLPYNIATTLIINWMKSIEIFSMIIVMVQREVANRLTAKFSSSSYGRISIIAQLHSKIEKIIDVSPKNFFSNSIPFLRYMIASSYSP